MPSRGRPTLRVLQAQLDKRAGHVPPGAVSEEDSVYQEMQESLLRADREKDPSLTSIPRFFKGVHTSAPSDLGQRIRREATHRLLQKKTVELLDEPDLHKLLELLKAKAKTYQSAATKDLEVIDYKSFQEVYLTLLLECEEGNSGCISPGSSERKFGPFFRARSFLKFGSLVSEIGIVPFFSYVVRKVNIKQTRIQLSYYDTLSHGYLREKDVENFIFELIPTLPQLQQLQEEFYPFYVFTAVRKFFFFLDPKRTGKIHIRTLLPSTILPELYELRAEEEKSRQNAENWFSVESALRVYGLYLELDADQNGMLSPSELSKYGSGMLSEEFIQRVFEEYQTYRDDSGQQEMDYKTFLDFVLAMKQKQSKQSIEYIWRLLDIRHDNKMDASVIRYFLRGIMRNLETHMLDKGIRIEDVTEEIFDMIRPTNPGWISLEDIYGSKMGVTVLGILTDTQAFFNYDNRENMFSTEEEEEEE